MMKRSSMKKNMKQSLEQSNSLEQGNSMKERNIMEQSNSMEERPNIGRDDYRRAMDQIKPDTELPIRLAQRLRERTSGFIQSKPAFRKSFSYGFSYKMVSLLVIMIVIATGVGLWQSGVVNQRPGQIAASSDQPPSNIATPTPEEHTDPNVVVIPQIELPEKSNAMANMIGLVVYQGNIYTQTNTNMAPEIAESLRGEKLGRTKGNIDEWSKPSDYLELASTIGVTDIYSVKGYDSDFRIMSFQKYDGEVYAELYERLNGISIGSGADLIGKTQLQGNVEAVRWQEYNDWYYSTGEFHEYEIDQTFHAFVTALYEAKPIDADLLYKEGIYNNGAQNQKVVCVKLRDQTEVNLWLFKGNYVKYSAHVFFQLDPTVFAALWDRM